MEQGNKILQSEDSSRFSADSETLMKLGREFYSRGWLFGTSGNLSTVLEREPLRLAITASGVDKGRLNSGHVLEIDQDLSVLRGNQRPSSESALHVAVVNELGAGAVFHTHSVWSTALSELYGEKGGIEINGYEMLKGLHGVNSHEHAEWIPIFENSQNMNKLAEEVTIYLRKNPGTHGLILKGHGLYTWGRDAEEAKRHVEVIEFLLEVVGRTRSA